jgi:hypothetical protein
MVPSVIDLIGSGRLAITEADPAIIGLLPAPGRHSPADVERLGDLRGTEAQPERLQAPCRQSSLDAGRVILDPVNRLPNEPGILRNLRNSERLVPQHRPHRPELLARIARFPAEVGPAFSSLGGSFRPAAPLSWLRPAGPCRRGHEGNQRVADGAPHRVRGGAVESHVVDRGRRSATSAVEGTPVKGRRGAVPSLLEPMRKPHLVAARSDVRPMSVRRRCGPSANEVRSRSKAVSGCRSSDAGRQ